MAWPGDFTDKGTRRRVIFEGDPLSPENEQLLLDRQMNALRRGVRSGIGPEVADEEIFRAMMVVRANTMVYEAATPQLTQMLLDLLNNYISPVVQSRGSPGEGDLPMMSNIGGWDGRGGSGLLAGTADACATGLAQAGLQSLAPFAADDAALTSTNAYTISDLMAEIQTLANPVPAQGNALVRNVEDMETFTRQRVARSRLALSRRCER